MALRTDQKMDIIDLHRGGLTIRAIASATGLSATTIQKYLAEWFTNEDGTILVGRKRGLDGKVRPTRRFDTTTRDAEIIRLYRRGKTIKDVAAQTECSVGTVHRVVSAPSSRPM